MRDSAKFWVLMCILGLMVNALIFSGACESESWAVKVGRYCDEMARTAEQGVHGSYQETFKGCIRDNY